MYTDTLLKRCQLKMIGLYRNIDTSQGFITPAEYAGWLFILYKSSLDRKLPHLCKDYFYLHD